MMLIDDDADDDDDEEEEEEDKDLAREILTISSLGFTNKYIPICSS